MEGYYYLRDVQDLQADGKSQNERRFGESFKGTIIPFDASVGHLPNSEKDKNSSIWKESITNNPSRTSFDRWRLWEEDILIADIEEIGQVGCIRNIHQKTECERSPDNPKDGEFVFPAADGSAKLSGQEPTRRGESTVRREKPSGESHGDREEFQPEESKDDAEARKDFWSIQENFIYCHHTEPSVQPTCREKNLSLFHKIHIIERNSSEKKMYDPEGEGAD